MTMTLPDWSGSALGFTPGAYSRPAELIEPVVIDAEVMRYLVYDGDPHLVRDLFGRRTTTQDRQPVDRDPVRQHAGVRRRTSVGQRHTVIEPEQVRRGTEVFDDDGDVAHQPPELRRDAVERFLDERSERIFIDIDHTTIMTATSSICTGFAQRRKPCIPHSFSVSVSL